MLGLPAFFFAFEWEVRLYTVNWNASTPVRHLNIPFSDQDSPCLKIDAMTGHL